MRVGEEQRREAQRQEDQLLDICKHITTLDVAAIAGVVAAARLLNLGLLPTAIVVTLLGFSLVQGVYGMVLIARVTERPDVMFLDRWTFVFLRVFITGGHPLPNRAVASSAATFLAAAMIVVVWLLLSFYALSTEPALPEQTTSLP